MDLSERPAGAFRRHPWEIARSRFLRSVLKAHGADRARSVLDVGAGDGWFSQQMLKDLPDAARITCWDAEYGSDALATLNARDAGRIAYVREQPHGTFDLVVLLDVLEHVDDERGFLAALLRENIGPDTIVLITVPAWQALYTSHDERLRHYRRYAPTQGKRLLDEMGLRIEVSGGLFHSLLLPRAAQKLREATASHADRAHVPPETLEWRGGRWTTRAVDLALRADNAVSRLASRFGWSVPGLSWWALCRRA